MSGLSRRQVRLFAAAVSLFLVFTVLAVFVAVGGQAVPGPDRWVADHLYGLSADHDPLAATARFVGEVTEPNVLRLIVLGWVIVLLVRGGTRVAIWLLITMTLAALVGIGAKLVYTRPRPLWDDPIVAIDGYSFPSGHAVNSMVFAACLVVVAGAAVRPAARVWLRIAALAFVLLVGLDRMLLGVHYLSDVVAGWAIGASIVLVMLGAWPPVRLSTAIPDEVETQADVPG